MINKVGATEKIYSDNTPECPYCRAILKKFPEKKTKCKECQNYFYLMSKPGTDIYFIVDEKRKSKWINEKHQYGRLKMLTDYYGLSENYVRLTVAAASSLRDAVWNCYNKTLEINLKNYRTQSNIYYSMAEFVTEEGKDPSLLLNQYCESRLDEIECHSSSIKLFAAIIAKGLDNCSNCKHLDGITLEVSEARNRKLIPVSPCRGKLCSAMYTGIGQRDIFGKVITTNNR